MIPKNPMVVIFLGLSFLLNYGCSSLPYGSATPGKVSYSLGELKSVEEAALDRTWDAVQKAVEDLGATITSRQKDALTANLIARGSNDKRIEINLKKISEGLTDMRIKVGTIGDETLSRHILEKIKQNLGERGEVAAAATATYSLGELRSIEEASFDNTFEAAQKALEDSEFAITSKQKDPSTANLIGRGSGDKKIEVNLKKVSDNLTEVRIRVGTLGDEALSRQVLERLKKYLMQ